MVYKRSGARRTTTRRPKEWYNQTYSAGDVAAKAWEGVKMLKGIINSELKEVTVTNTGAQFSTTGNVNLLSGIGTGDTETGREGNSVLAKTLQLRFHTAWQSNAGTSLNRVIIFRDKQCNPNTTPTIAELLETDIMGRLNHDTDKRWQIMLDKTFPTDSTKRSFVLNKTMKIDQHLLFYGTGSSEFQKNPIFIATIGDFGATTQGNTYKYSAKMNYYDN